MWLGIAAALVLWTAAAVVWTLEAGEEVLGIGQGKGPAVASDVLDHTIVAYESPESGVEVQTLRMGATVGAPLQMSSSGAAEGNVAAAHLTENEFVVVWEAVEDEGTSIRGQRMRVEDEAAGSTVPGMGVTVGIPLLITSSGSAPAVGADADGDFVVAWTGPDLPAPARGDPGGGQVPFARRLSRMGAALGSPLQFRMGATVGAPLKFRMGVTVGAPLQLDPPALAVRPDGEFLVAWEDAAGDIRGSVVDAADNVVRDGLRISDPGPGRHSSPAATVPLDGSFAVVWERRGPSEERTVIGRRLAVDGTRLGGELQVSLAPSTIATLPAVAADPWGRVLVTWTSCGAGSDARSVLARPLDLGGAAGGEMLLAWPDAVVSAVGASSTADDFVVVWESGPGEISSRFVQVPEP